MIIDNKIQNKMIEMVNNNNENITYDNFTLLSVECLIDDIIDMLIERKCNIEDINLLLKLLPQRLMKCEMKKGDKMSPNF